MAVDSVRAFEFYHKAADQGLSEAEFNLGCCYEYGLGTNVDEVKALEYYLLAADHGNARAEYNLGLCYEDGHVGLPKNLPKAFKYFVKARCSL